MTEYDLLKITFETSLQFFPDERKILYSYSGILQDGLPYSCSKFINLKAPKQDFSDMLFEFDEKMRKRFDEIKGRNMLTSKFPIEYTFLNGVVKCTLTIRRKILTDEWLKNWDHYYIKNGIIKLYFVGTPLEVKQEILNAEDDNFRRPAREDNSQS